MTAPSAYASSSGTLPAAARGHAYRHGVVPRRGQALQSTTTTQSGTTTAPSTKLAYGGAIDGVGVATGAPKVYLVFWGSQWGTPATNGSGDTTLSGDPDAMALYVQEFLKGLGTGGETWSGVMTQYCQGVSTNAQACPTSNTQHVGYPTGGALAGVWVDEPTGSPSQATGHQLAQEAMSAAAHFDDYSSRSQYVIVSPTGTNPDDYENPTTGFCAWHDYTGDSTLDGGGGVASPGGKPPIAFTNLPYIPDAGASCGQNFVNAGSAGTLDGVSIVEGHEYAETITDTFPAGGWTDNLGNEDGDKCAWISSPKQGYARDITLTTGTFAVQSTWANDASACEVSHPIVTNPPTTVTVAAPGDQSNTVETSASLQISASDSDPSQTLSYSATGLPGGISIDSGSGLISGTPTAPGSYPVTVTVTDGNGASGTASFTWTIAGRTTSTSVSCAPSSLTLGSATICTATVSDTAAGIDSSPTETVTFTGSTGCSLTATPSPGIATCQSRYVPTTAGTPTVAAGYAGDSLHLGSSSGGFGVSVTTVPQNQSVPVIAGKAALGGVLSCSPGSWAGSPTSYAYRWKHNGAAIPGAGKPRYAVQAVDQGKTVTCTVTASNAWGAGTPATSQGITVPTTCPAATGRISGVRLGLVRLGMTRRQARVAYPHSSRSSSRYQDYFCLTPAGVRVGYASPKLLATLSRSRRGALTGRAVWVTTANRRYAADGIRPGATLAGARRVLAQGAAFKTGRTTWYLVRGSAARFVFQVQGGVVREIGIAVNQLVQTVGAERILVRNLS